MLLLQPRRAPAARLIALGGWLAGCAGTGGPSGEGPVVTGIEILGAEAVSGGAIKKRLATRETGWWPFAKKHRFDPVEWQVDLERIERYYETQGYYRAQVVDSQRIEKGPDTVALRVRVRENQPVRIGEVTVRGLERLVPERRESLLEDLPVRPADVFLERRWVKAKTLILDRLKDDGHAAAALVGEARLDLRASRGKLDLLVDPGRSYHFGEVIVNAPPGSRVNPSLVREQIELALGSDRRYSEETLEEAQRRVFAMGVFATARVAAGEPDPASGLVPVVVDLREAPLHTVRLGAGLAIDQVRQEARLLAGWGDRNFLGGLRKLGLEAVAGWAFIPNVLAVARDEARDTLRDGAIARATAELQQPRFMSRPSLGLVSLLEAERTVEPAYDALGGRARVGLTWQPRSSAAVSGSYNLQGYWLNGPAAVTPATAPLTLGCAADPCFVRLSYLEQIVTWDRRDHPLEPRRGFYVSLALQQGGGPLGGDFDYLRILPEARAYATPGDDGALTVALRLRVGTLVPRSGRAEDSPVVARFYAGGANSMRGFGLRRLSPMLLLPVDPDRPELRVALPIGGNSLVEGSLELRIRVAEKLLLAAFVDFGAVTRERLPLLEPGALLWATGVGLRYLSPIGPIRLDLGVRLPFGRPPPLYDPAGAEITYQRLPGDLTDPGREDGRNIDRSCFGIGGSGASSWVPGDLCTVHISIGEAF